MELTFFVQCMIVIFTICGSTGNATVLDSCDKYSEKFCKCSDVDQVKETSLKMCTYKDGDNAFSPAKPCQPCQGVDRDNATCAQCPELACPACNIRSVELTSNQTMLPVVEVEDGFQNNTRVKRDSQGHKGQKWCRIENELSTGIFTCKSWRDRRECVLKCSQGDKYMNGNMHLFSCDRNENIWRMELKPCEAGRSRKNNFEMPMNKIIVGPENGYRLFMPRRHVQVGGQGADYDYDGYHMDDEISQEMRSDQRVFKRSYDFMSDDVDASNAVEDSGYPAEDSFWMMTNESSISYASYKDDL